MHTYTIGRMDSTHNMTYGMRRRLTTSTLAVAIVVAASMGVTACSSSGTSAAGRTGSTDTHATGTTATSEICQDVATRSTTLVQPLLPILSGTADPAQIQQDVKQVESAATAWATALRAEAAKAQDPVFAAALRSTATQIEMAAFAQLGAPDLTGPGLEAALTTVLTAASGLYAYCPGLAQLGE